MGSLLTDQSHTYIILPLQDQMDFFDGGIVEGITPRHFILGWDF